MNIGDIRVLEPKTLDDHDRYRYCYQCSLSDPETFTPATVADSRAELLTALAEDAHTYFGSEAVLEHGPLHAWIDDEFPHGYAGRQEFFLRPDEHYRDKHDGRRA